MGTPKFFLTLKKKLKSYVCVWMCLFFVISLMTLLVVSVVLKCIIWLNIHSNLKLWWIENYDIKPKKESPMHAWSACNETSYYNYYIIRLLIVVLNYIHICIHTHTYIYIYIYIMGILNHSLLGCYLFIYVFMLGFRFD